MRQFTCRSSSQKRTSKGFTLVELLVVISIIGVLMGLTLPAVMSVREASRRTVCGNNMRQLGLALQNFESTHGKLPMGAEFETGHSWIGRLLPYLELSSIENGINFDEMWNAAINESAVFMPVPLVQCPSSQIKQYRGFTDYCGISGSSLGTAALLEENNGIFFSAVDSRSRSIKARDIRDGLSQTIAIAEAVAVAEVNFGYWACGWHCFSHDDGGINNLDGGYNEIASLHRSGANVVFADASVHFLNEQISLDVLGALCTRNGNEVVGDF